MYLKYLYISLVNVVQIQIRVGNKINHKQIVKLTNLTQYIYTVTYMFAPKLTGYYLVFVNVILFIVHEYAFCHKYFFAQY